MIAIGSHGEFTFDSDGNVTHTLGCDCCEGYVYIARVDVAELRSFYAEHMPGADFDSFDILELGFWDTDGAYTEAEPDFREHLKDFTDGN